MIEVNKLSIENIAREAGELILKYFNDGTGVSFERKSDRSPVTQADLEAQAFIDERLYQYVPDIPVFGEELSKEQIKKRMGGKDHDTYWIVDPLDGTHNFATGIDIFCVSIGLVHKGVPVLGVIYDPVRKEMFSARRGEGAFLNGMAITTNGVKDYPDYIFFVQMRRLNPRLRAYVSEFLSDNIYRIREIGSTALKLAWIACGKCDANIQDQINFWDSTAGILIAQEAGGICTDFIGNPIEFTPYGVHELWVAANEHLHKWVREGIKPYLIE